MRILIDQILGFRALLSLLLQGSAPTADEHLDLAVKHAFSSSSGCLPAKGSASPSIAAESQPPSSLQNPEPPTWRLVSKMELAAWTQNLGLQFRYRVVGSAFRSHGGDMKSPDVSPRGSASAFAPLALEALASVASVASVSLPEAFHHFSTCPTESEPSETPGCVSSVLDALANRHLDSFRLGLQGFWGSQDVFEQRASWVIVSILSGRFCWACPALQERARERESTGIMSPLLQYGLRPMVRLLTTNWCCNSLKSRDWTRIRRDAGVSRNPIGTSSPPQTEASGFGGLQRLFPSCSSSAPLCRRYCPAEVLQLWPLFRRLHKVPVSLTGGGGCCAFAQSTGSRGFYHLEEIKAFRVAGCHDMFMSQQFSFCGPCSYCSG